MMKEQLLKLVRDPRVVGPAAFAAGIGVGWAINQRRWSKVVNEGVDVIEDAVEVIEQTAESRNQLALDFAAAVDDAARIEMSPEAMKAMNDYSGGIVNEQAVRDLYAQEYRRRMIEPAEQDLRDIVLGTPEPATVVQFPVPDPEPEMEQYDGWDQEEEEKNRGPNAPYTIHRDEFYQNETGFDQDDLVYYSGDDILCDKNNVPVHNQSTVVGRLEFGRGSGESDVVYVRNEELKAEYQVHRVESTYALEVLGIEAEEEAEKQDLKHSSEIRRFRD
jgi:hypothetical protein